MNELEQIKVRYTDRAVHITADTCLTGKLLDPKSGMPSTLQNVLKPALARVKRSTEVIDCGERAVDTNRFVFDTLAPFCELISKVLE